MQFAILSVALVLCSNPGLVESSCHQFQKTGPDGSCYLLDEDITIREGETYRRGIPTCEECKCTQTALFCCRDPPDTLHVPGCISVRIPDTCSMELREEYDLSQPCDKTIRQTGNLGLWNK